MLDLVESQGLPEDKEKLLRNKKLNKELLILLGNMYFDSKSGKIKGWIEVIDDFINDMEDLISSFSKWIKGDNVFVNGRKYLMKDFMSIIIHFYEIFIQFCNDLLLNPAVSDQQCFGICRVILIIKNQLNQLKSIEL